LIRSVLGHYKILRKLGAGAMGEVYLAEDQTLGRQVALKILPSHFTEDPDRRRRFQREAQAVAALSHPNIVTLHSLEEADGVHFLTMEYVDGSTLSQLIPPDGIPAQRFIDLAFQLVDALAFAHARGIVHRDLKPANVMVTADGRAKIVDFGIAKLTQPDRVDGSPGEAKTQTMTVQGAVIGTAAYMSPEQALGQETDHRSDIFSLGIVLYELATGRRPFAGETTFSILNAVVATDPIAPSKVNPGVEPEVERIIQKAIVKDPAGRYQSAEELREDLLHIARSDLPLPDRYATKRSRPVARRRPWRGLAIAAVVVVAVLAGWLLPRLGGRLGTRSGDVLAVSDFLNAPNPDDAVATAGFTELLQIGLGNGSSRVVSQELWQDLRRRLFGASGTPMSPDQSLEVARRAGATALLAGRMEVGPARCAILWRLVNVRNGDQIAGGREEGADLTSAADRVVRAVCPHLPGGTRQQAASMPSVESMTSSAPAAYEEYVKGLLARQNGEFAEARGHFLSAVEIDSTFALAYVRLSESYASEGEERASAIAAAQKATSLRSRLDPKSLLYLQARLDWIDWKLPETIANYQEILKRWPDDRQAMIRIADAHMWYANYVDVVPITDKAMALYPDDLDILLTRWESLLALDRSRQVIRECDAFAKRNPANAWPLRTAAEAYLRLGLPDSADVRFRAAAALDSRINYEGILTSYCRGDVAKAIATQERLENRGYFPGLAGLYAEVGRVNDAVACVANLDSLLRGDDTEIPGLATKALFLVRVGRGKEGLTLARDAMAKATTETRRAQALTGLIPALIDQGMLGEAEREIEWYRALAGREAITLSVVHWYATLLDLASRKPAEAVAAAHEMGRLGMPFGEEDIDYRSLLARAYRMNGQRDEAVSTLTALLKVYGGHAKARLDLGRLYHEMGRDADAERELRAFLDAWSGADPDRPELTEARDLLASLRKP
jgi:serine/threonine protein kinase